MYDGGAVLRWTSNAVAGNGTITLTDADGAGDMSLVTGNGCYAVVTYEGGGTDSSHLEDFKVYSEAPGGLVAGPVIPYLIGAMC